MNKLSIITLMLVIAACASEAVDTHSATSESGLVTANNENDRCNAPCNPNDPGEISCSVKCGFLAYCPEYTASEMQWCSSHKGFYLSCLRPAEEFWEPCDTFGNPCSWHDCLSGAAVIVPTGNGYIPRQPAESGPIG